ncbi:MULTISPECIES: hypothetical protein [Deinococcus]|uniref:DUF2267 domain-containing protein n=1 Tax=Deinococcus rufus TaxID=2136097 RepID=A0ABV7ZB61_9DEIO|nr:hypothetical protein [Deinococcus sp. AB2017081]WQE94666.1 hypothetical protein U2P90_14820 [Deinococcus sp. AB2017081]
MPDLDNMAKKVKGLWKRYGVRAAIADAEQPAADGTSRLAEMLKHILSRVAATYAGVEHLPAFREQLQRLAALPLQERGAAFAAMRFPIIPEGKESVVRAARQVGILICEGQVTPAQVPVELARRFLVAIPDAEFFGRLVSEDYPALFRTEAEARVSLQRAQSDVAEFAAGAAPEFAASMFQTVPAVPRPEVPRRDTAEQMEGSVNINFDLLDDEDD